MAQPDRDLPGLHDAIVRGCRLIMSRQKSTGEWPQEAIRGCFQETTLLEYPNYTFSWFVRFWLAPVRAKVTRVPNTGRSGLSEGRTACCRKVSGSHTPLRRQRPTKDRRIASQSPMLCNARRAVSLVLLKLKYALPEAGGLRIQRGSISRTDSRTTTGEGTVKRVRCRSRMNRDLTRGFYNAVQDEQAEHIAAKIRHTRAWEANRWSKPTDRDGDARACYRLRKAKQILLRGPTRKEVASVSPYGEDHPRRSSALKREGLDSRSLSVLQAQGRFMTIESASWTLRSPLEAHPS